MHSKALVPYWQLVAFCTSVAAAAPGYAEPPSHAGRAQETEQKIGRHVCVVSVSFRDQSLAEIIGVVDREGAKGADLIVLPETWRGQTDNPESLDGPTVDAMATVRALENQVFFLACGKAGEEGPKSFYGNCTIAGPNGELIYEDKPEHPNGEKVIRATLKREDLIRIRGYNTPFRNRRPELYGALTKPF